MHAGRAAWTAAGVLAVLLATGFGVYHLSRSRCFAVFTEAVCHVDTSAPLVALTFDDGPTSLGVDSVLPALKQANAKATFFLVGEALERPELAARIRAAGHELGNHSYSHQRMAFKSSAFYASEIDRTEAMLNRLGSNSRLFRPPHGKKLIGLPLALERRRLKMIMWDVEDPLTDDPLAFARDVVEQARPGSIILVHAMNRPNDAGRKALPLILQGLQARGLRPVTVGELLASGDAERRTR